MISVDNCISRDSTDVSYTNVVKKDEYSPWSSSELKVIILLILCAWLASHMKWTDHKFPK